LNGTPIDQLIQIRLDQAKESLEEAEMLFHSGYLRGAVNRAYYAMFYAALALTVLRQQSPSKLIGVIAFIDKDFVKKGIFSKEMSRLLHLAFQRRQDNDYGEVFTVNEEETRQAIQEAQAFISTVNQYVQSLR